MNAHNTTPGLIQATRMDYSYHNALPLLHEIAHALQRLHQNGTTTTIDLNAIPFGPGDESRLLDLLGRGEVRATLDVLGESQIWESTFPGVWVVEHRAAGGERVALQIEITRLPGILQTQPEDLVEGLAKITKTLAHLATDEAV